MSDTLTHKIKKYEYKLNREIDPVKIKLFKEKLRFYRTQQGGRRIKQRGGALKDIAVGNSTADVVLGETVADCQTIRGVVDTVTGSLGEFLDTAKTTAAKRIGKNKFDAMFNIAKAELSNL